MGQKKQISKGAKQALKKRIDRLKALRRLLYVPYEKQEDFHKAGRDVRERLFLAGNRCGKTLSGSFEMVCHLTGFYPDWWCGARFDAPVQAWAASVTMEATRDILQQLYLGDAKSGAVGLLAQKDILGCSYKRGVSGAVDIVRVRHASGGVSTLGFKSYDQGREKFQGTARHVVHLDEEPPLDIYEECLMRTATVDGHVMLSMTPLLGLTPLVERFMEEISGRMVVRACWSDAPYLSDMEKGRLRAALRPHEVEAREKGVPVLGVGKVYPVLEEGIRVPRFEIPAEWPRVFGLDFGWSNPTAAVWVAWDKEHDIVYITDCYTRVEATPREHVQELQKRHVPVGVCDPAGQSASQADGVSLMEQYANAGCYLHKADNAVESGLMEILERMRTGRLKVFSDLEEWWREFRIYRRGRGGKIVKSHDHLMDATRYAVVSGLDYARGVERVSTVRRAVDWRVA